VMAWIFEGAGRSGSGFLQPKVANRANRAKTHAKVERVV
jgi:hypothetical protein